MKRYILAKGLEGTDWKNLILVATGSLEEIKDAFMKRERPYILWFLIDLDKLAELNIPHENFEEMFTAVNTKFPDLNMADYKVSPFASFYDMVATNRSWGELISLAK